MKRVALIVGVVLGAQVSAHEPLWGETAQTFAFGVIHPEIHVSYTNASDLFSGRNKVTNSDRARHTELEAEFAVQYGLKPELNFKLAVPIMNIEMQEGSDQIKATEIGDIVLSAKSRFNVKFAEDSKSMHAYVVGVALPTGKDNLRGPSGDLLSPSEQPGSGNLGLVLGYAYALETLEDTVWASAQYSKELGGGDRKGDRLSLDLAYGRWLKRAYRPDDLGIVFAIGSHTEFGGRDHFMGGPDTNSGFTTSGIHGTLIATKGAYQYRIGMIVPVYQNYNGEQLAPEYGIRAAIEAFF